MKFGINNPAWLQAAGNIGNTDPGTFYIEAIENNTTISFGYPTCTQISANDVDYSYATESMTINSGEKVYVKFDTITTPPMNPLFSIDKQFNIGGESPIVHAEFTHGGESISVEVVPQLSGSKVVDASKLVINLPSSAEVASMFSGCTSLVNAPKLPAENLKNNCYFEMFSGCTSLVNAPELPATTLADGCYESMFSGCTSLVNAPKLPATTLAYSCYRYMFSNCSNLRNVECLAVDISATDCTYNWVKGVSSEGTFIKAIDSNWSTGINGIPTGWTVQDYAG